MPKLFSLSSGARIASSAAVASSRVNYNFSNSFFYNGYGVHSSGVSFGLLVVAAAGEERYAESNSEEKN